MSKRLTKPCPHCSIEIEMCGYKSHALRCVENPRNTQRIRRAVRNLSIDGYMVTVMTYQEWQCELNLPSKETIQRRIGNWDDFAAWCGLRPASERPRAERYSNRIWFDGVPTVMAEDLVGSSGMPGLAWTWTVRVWCLKTYTWVPAVELQTVLLR